MTDQKGDRSQRIIRKLARNFGRAMRDRLRDANAHDFMSVIAEFTAGLEDGEECHAWFPVATEKFDKTTKKYEPAEIHLHQSISFNQLRLDMAREKDVNLEKGPSLDSPDLLIEPAENGIHFYFHQSGDGPLERLVIWRYDGSVDVEP